MSSSVKFLLKLPYQDRLELVGYDDFLSELMEGIKRKKYLKGILKLSWKYVLEDYRKLAVSTTWRVGHEAFLLNDILSVDNALVQPLKVHR